MFIIPQMGIGKSERNQAVRLWDGANTANTTVLTTSNPTPDSTVLSPSGLIAFWLRQLSGTFTITTQQTPSDNRGMIFQFAGNTGFFKANDVGGNSILSAFPNNLPSHSANWHHYLMTYNFGSSTANIKISIDGSPVFSATNNHGGLTLFQRTPFALNYQGASPAELYDFFHVADGGYDAYDIDIIRKFINADGTPVKLGSRGRRPFGSLPRLFYSGSANRWVRNKGSLILPDLAPSVLGNFGKASSVPS